MNICPNCKGNKVSDLRRCGCCNGEGMVRGPGIKKVPLSPGEGFDFRPPFLPPTYRKTVTILLSSRT